MTYKMNNADNTQTPAEALQALINVVAWEKQHSSAVRLQHDDDDLQTIVLGLLDLAMEHQASVALLGSAGNLGGMFAMQRVLQETVVRGLWFRHCASDYDVRRFKNGRMLAKHGEMVKQLEAASKSDAVLSALGLSSWGIFSDFTHGGYPHLVLRHSRGRMSPAYPDSDIAQAYQLAGALGLVAARELADISGRPDLVESALAQLTTQS